MNRIRGLCIAAACAVATVIPAAALATAPAAGNPGYDWAVGSLKDLVTHHGWRATDQGNLGRSATRRELARGLAEVMTALGQTSPATPVLPPHITATDPDATAIAWVTANGALGSPTAAFEPDGHVTAWMADAAIVHVFGLDAEAAALSALHTENGTRLAIPAGFAVEVLAGELELRHEYDARHDNLATSDGAPMPIAALAGMIDAAIKVPDWRLASMSQFTSIVLPNLTVNQRTAVQAALAEVGMPYIWGGVRPRTRTLFGASVPGGFDCSGLVWWAYKLGPRGWARWLGRDIVGRTSDDMAWERRSQRVATTHLLPGDLVFVGAQGRATPRGGISHTAIYLGNGWIAQSTGSRGGVSVSYLPGFWTAGLAWGRRPAAMVDRRGGV